MRVRTKLFSLMLPIALLAGTGLLTSGCDPLPDVCRDMQVHQNVHDAPTGIGVAHVNVYAHVCFYANTSQTSPQTSVSWDESEYGALQSFIKVDFSNVLPRIQNGSNGAANWLGGFHVATCAGIGVARICSFGTDFGCAVHDDPPTVQGFGYAFCQKTGGHGDFYMDGTNGVVHPKPTMTVAQRIAQLKRNPPKVNP